MAAPVEDSWLWTTDGTGDGATTYTQSDTSKFCAVLGNVSGSQGIMPKFGNCYNLTTESETAIIDTGGAIVDGKPHQCTTAGSVAVPSACGAGCTRIDRIVLRASWAAQTVRITRIPGSSSSAPTAPAVTQTPGTTYDLPLWRVLVDTGGTIVETDTRAYSSCALAGSGLHVGASGMLTIAPDAVDDTKVGNRVPQFYRRQGGNSDAWATAGLTDYTPTTVRMQAGVFSSCTSGLRTVTFPTAFSNTPIVLCSAWSTGGLGFICGPTAVTAACFDSLTVTNGGGAAVGAQVDWLAIGPE